MNTSQKLFVDTNIFIHILTDGDLKKQKSCIRLFEKAYNNKLQLWTTEWVIAEVVWVLDKQNIKWIKTKEIITKLLNTRGLEVRNKNWIVTILELCNRNEDLFDCINISLAFSENIKSGYSYDKGLDKIDNFKRLEP